MVPAEQVQNPVCQKHRQLGEQIAPVRPRLSPRGRYAQDDVAEQVAREMTERPFALSKCQDVGRSILSSIGAV